MEGRWVLRVPPQVQWWSEEVGRQRSVVRRLRGQCEMEEGARKMGRGLQRGLQEELQSLLRAVPPSGPSKQHWQQRQQRGRAASRLRYWLGRQRASLWAWVVVLQTR